MFAGCRDGLLSVWEDGVVVPYLKGEYYKGDASFGSYTAGEELAVMVQADTMCYMHKGKVLHTSKQPPCFPLVVDCSFCRYAEMKAS